MVFEGWKVETLAKVTSYITNKHADPTHFIICPECGGWIIFNLEELQEYRSKGQSTSVYCPARKGNHRNGKPEYHPGYPGSSYNNWPAQEIRKLGEDIETKKKISWEGIEIYSIEVGENEL